MLLSWNRNRMKLFCSRNKFIFDRLPGQCRSLVMSEQIFHTSWKLLMNVLLHPSLLWVFVLVKGRSRSVCLYFISSCTSLSSLLTLEIIFNLTSRCFNIAEKVVKIMTKKNNEINTSCGKSNKRVNQISTSRHKFWLLNGISWILILLTRMSAECSTLANSRLMGGRKTFPWWHIQKAYIYKKTCPLIGILHRNKRIISLFRFMVSKTFLPRGCGEKCLRDEL